MLYIRPYKKGSASARLLRQALQIRTLTAKTALGEGDIVLNWGGMDDMPDNFNNDTMYSINNPEAIRRAVSKVETLRAIGRNNFFTNRENLISWIENKGGMPAGMVIYCRTLTRASKGRGIVVAKTVEEIVDAPLYAYAYPCKREYRVHLFAGRTVDLVAKVRIIDKNHPKYKATPDPHIRNSETGYVFARNSVKIPNSVRENLEYHSREAVNNLGLTFGAVDIVRDVNDNYTVLEVNTAPGIMGSALAAYVDAINYQVRQFLGDEVLNRSDVGGEFFEDEGVSSGVGRAVRYEAMGTTRRESPSPAPPSSRRPARSRGLGSDSGRARAVSAMLRTSNDNQG